MTKKEALESLLAKLDNPEDYDEEIAVLSATISESVTTKENGEESNPDDSYRARYDKLKEAYKNRFGEMLNETLDIERQKGMNLMGNANAVSNAPSMEELDWDGSTE